MSFEGVFNLRDLGGTPTSDGRTLRPGRLYRADDPGRLTDVGRRDFTALGITTIVDLRRPAEIDRHGRIDDPAYRHLHLEHPKWQHRRHPDTADRVAFLLERYGEMTESGAAAIGDALRIIADPERAPVLVHCLAGKDRTGIVIGVTLALLGVSDVDIAADYTRSEAAEAASWARYVAEYLPDEADRDHIVSSPPDAMLGLLADLRTRYGSIESYAEQRLGLTVDQLTTMRAHLLTD